MKRVLLITVMTVSLSVGMAFLGSCPVCAGTVEDLYKRVEQLEETVKKQEEGTKNPFSALGEKVTFSGAIELDYSYTDPEDVTDQNSDSTSDLDVGTFELGVDARFYEWVTGNVILKGENLDDDDRVFWDEVTITIQKEGFPLYFVGGKRAQPFGVFNSHLISDPITQDCYKVAKSGATVGLTHDFLGLDVSATLYKGEVLADKLSESGYGWERDPNPNPDPTDDVSSYILNISMVPFEGARLNAYFDSEPGQGDRNETAGGAIEYTVGPVIFDAEYITALNREKNVTANKKYKESAWFVAIAYQVVDSLELAARYEAFEDDQDGDQDGYLEDRYLIGTNYTFFENDNISTVLMFEYRRSNYEKSVSSTAHNKANEFFAKMAIEF